MILHGSHSFILSDYLISFLSIRRSFVSIDWLVRRTTTKKEKRANMKANLRHYVLWRPWSIMISKVKIDEWRWSKQTVRIRLWFGSNIFFDLTTCGTRIYSAWSLLSWRLPTRIVSSSSFLCKLFRQRTS